MKFDSYTRRARLYPALLMVLPLALSALVWFPDDFFSWSNLWALLGYCGLTALLAQIGRDLGKRKEPELFMKWGDTPTTRKLRYRDCNNPITLRRYHQRLQQLIPDLDLPTAEEEAADPEKADRMYESCVQFLRQRTRDKKRFNLIFEENVSYGFRRNMWGMKPIGLPLAVLGTASVFGKIVLAWKVGVLPIAYIALMLNAFLLICWLTWITENWVRLAAEGYADRLLASCDDL